MPAPSSGHPVTAPSQPCTLHGRLGRGQQEAGQTESPSTLVIAGKHLSCSLARMAQLPWLQQSLALGPGPLGRSARNPPVLTVQPGESPGHDGVLCPQRAEAVSPAVCASTEARVRPTWPQVSEGGLMSGKGWPRGSSWQVLLGSTHPYLPGSAEGSPGAAAASPMAARTWPETAATGSSLSSRRRESPAGPSESGAGLCFL